ncbi:MAG: chromate efflux transporter [Hyphomicrobiaceae bacterium]|nr:chromate efflux transporter [Hyphomicrobiaceae bacterium]
MAETISDPQVRATAHPTYGEAVAAWTRIGLLSFGGPAGQIALMHKVVVDEKRWLDERQFLSALNFCMLLPGPEAMQLATYVGWRLHGIAGGLAAGLLFVIPGALVVLALSAFYAAFGNVPLVAALFVGVKAAVLAIVIQALLKVAGRALKGTGDWLIAAAAFVAIFLFKLPFPLIVLTAALIGYLRGMAGHQPSTGHGGGNAHADAGPSLVLPAPRSTIMGTLATIAVWIAIWVVPLAAISLALGPAHVLSQASVFFSKLAVVTFGGAYAVLAYMAQEAVDKYGWLKPGEMLDGLGLAETTPGPLILVTEFVGFQAGHRWDGGGNWPMALATAGVTLWATFAPCFLWIFAGAPYVERLNAIPKLKAALAAVTAAVVGVILNLSVWFAINVLFRSVSRVQWGPLDLGVPQLASLDAVAGALAALAAVLLFWANRGVLTVLAVCAAFALAGHAIRIGVGA